MAHFFRITQTHSESGSNERVRATLRGLGLSRRGKTSALDDTPQIRGMIRKVHHLVQVERVEGTRPEEGR
jgi:large subunit ribosomal protein L30